MVHVAMTKNDRRRPIEIKRSGKQARRLAWGIKGAASIQNQAFAILTSDFDARAANCFGAAMNGDCEGQAVTRAIWRCGNNTPVALASKTLIPLR